MSTDRAEAAPEGQPAPEDPTPEAATSGEDTGTAPEEGAAARDGAPEEDGSDEDGAGDAPVEGAAPDADNAPDAPDADATGGAGVEDGTEDGAEDEGSTGTDGAASGTAVEAGGEQLSEAQAELAAQRELRERIARRKADKDGPIAAGTALSGTAADLLAAVRAVEGGGKSTGSSVFDAPAPAAPEPAERAVPASARPLIPEPSREPVAGPEALAAARAALTAGGAPDALAPQAVAALGEQAGDVLRADPWQLLALAGVRPEQADGYARALLGAECGPGDERRTAALVGHFLERAALQGHTALDADQVRASLAAHAVPDPDEALEHAVAEGVVLAFREDEDEEAAEGEADGYDEERPEGEQGAVADAAPAAPVQVLLGLDRYALAEESLADGLARLVNSCESDEEWGGQDGGLAGALAANGLVVHTGGEAARAEAAALVGAARSRGLRACGAAHTANGRRRLAGSLGDAAVTVAGLLSGAEGPGRDGEGALALDLLVVLDAPQLDVESAAMLVEALPDGCRLVLSGDPGVLGAAGAGRVFGDVLASRACPQIASRVPDPGPIGELVSGIGIGELNRVEAPGREVVIVPVRDAGEAVHRTVQLVADSVPRAIGVASADTQVITVGHGGSAGTRALNAALKQRLNPGPGRFGGFDPGDRVAHSPAPGRTVQATVVSADAQGLRLDCEGEPLVVPKERVEATVRHGWALTAHQAAGMRWAAAVVVLPGDAAQGLSRPWVYTAFGRGERHLSVVHGVDQELPRAVAERPAPERTTRLRALLEATPAPVA
ncbi:AAA family ATPase [Streptomyces sp. NPDC050504]|uniref:AAA family ATPase n=1 Tax=Streptomyces sp. NPDC050504 TaxID=3365618 RepID=UPI0037B52FF2